jgi:hypothetical protein
VVYVVKVNARLVHPTVPVVQGILARASQTTPHVKAVSAVMRCVFAEAAAQMTPMKPV